MAKALKAALQALFNGGNGVTVIEEGSNFQVAFGFSNNLVNKIKILDGAKFDKDNGVWNVPADVSAELVNVVADMRDFVGNNGVQVKDVADGKQVLFDYNKELTQVIGAVSGAKFDGTERVWNVAADSKALVVEEGQSTSYLDLAVNKMRGINIETAKDRDSIMELATASATGRGMKPGFVFPDKEHSYTGPILNVNSHFAAQLSGTDDKKGVGYITIHTLSDLGKAVFKGDDLRIDYDENRQVGVRTTAVFQQQQKERSDLTALAAGKVDGAEVRNASTKDGVKHNGSVVQVTDHFVLQHLGRAAFVIHGRDALGKADITKDQKLEISYKGNKGTVVDLNKKNELAGAER